MTEIAASGLASDTWVLETVTASEAPHRDMIRQRRDHGARVESNFKGNPLLTGRDAASTDPDRHFRLLASAFNELAEAARRAGHDIGPGPRKQQFQSIDKLLRAFVTADGPTPQIRYRGSDGYDIRWLVDGDVVSLLVDDSHAVSVWINDGQGTVRVDEDYSDVAEVELDASDAIRGWLKDMSTRVRFPIVAFGAGA